MIYKLAFFAIAFVTSNLVYSQEPNNGTKYSQSIVIDSSITANYFKAEITVGEYFHFSGKGRNRSSEKFNLDTVKQILFFELRKLNFNTTLDLVKVSEREGSYKDNPTFQATYEFNIYSKDSVEYLYRNLSQNMPPFSLTRFKITPEVDQQRIKQSQGALEKRALERVKVDAQKFADSNKVSIKKIDTYQMSFIKKERFDADYYTNEQKAYNITFANPIYSLSVYYVFILE